MGEVLSCSSCNQKDIKQNDYCVDYNNTKTNKISNRKVDQNEEDEEFQFGKKNNNIHSNKIPTEERIRRLTILNLIRKIQKLFRFYLSSKKLNIQKEIEQREIEAAQPNPDKQKETRVLTNTNYQQTGEKNSGAFQKLGQNYKYIGHSNREHKQGFGIQIWNEEAKYSGNFKDNQANGIGKFIHLDGDIYFGDFINDRAYGFGSYTHSNGALYIGEWVDDAQENFGIEVWPDGSSYQGEYLQGMKSGFGTYNWADGTKYEGEWRENCLNGYGIYTFTDNRFYIGHWKDNMMHGYGEYNWKDDKKYLGFYVRDKKEGFGVYYWHVQNKAYIGFWKEGKQDGVGKYITPNKVRYGFWKGGERTKWYANEQEAFKELKENQKNFKEIFKYDLKDINSFLIADNQ